MKIHQVTRFPEERISIELTNLHFISIPLRGWFGRGFLALPSNPGKSGAAIFRKRSDGHFYVQNLENVGGLTKEELANLRKRSNLELPLLTYPYLPTKRKWNYSWQWLVPISEYRKHAHLYGMLVLEKDELRKPVGYKEPSRVVGKIAKIPSAMPHKQYWGERRRRMQGAWGQSKS